MNERMGVLNISEETKLKAKATKKYIEGRSC